MAFKSNVYQVFIASPSDVPEERELLRKVIWNWNYINSSTKNIVLIPVGWETHSMPLQGERAQGIINKYLLNKCDVLVAILWSKIGSPTGEAISGTVEEIDEFIKTGRPVFLYKSEVPFNAESVDAAQYSSLMDFIDRRKKDGLIEFYSTLESFKEKISNQLSLLVNTHPYFLDEVEELETEFEEPSDPLILEIMKEAGKDPKAEVRVDYQMGMKTLTTNGKIYFQSGASSIREQTRLNDIVTDLEITFGFVKELYRTQDGEVYQLTSDGFKYSDMLNAGYFSN
jgi:hypothetical protein